MTNFCVAVFLKLWIGEYDTKNIYIIHKISNKHTNIMIETILNILYNTQVTYYSLWKENERIENERIDK